MENNQPNFEATQPPSTNPLSLTSKKLSNKIITIGVLSLAGVALIFIVPKYWDVAGGGATNQKVPDQIKAPVTTDNSPSQSAGDVWKIYRNEKYNFEFSYPQNWILKDLIANPNQSNDSSDIAVGYMSPEQNAVRGITYCEAYSGQAPRCEIYNGFIIDWEYGGAMINDGVGGTIGISLKKFDAENKNIYRQTLSTFKFVK